MNSTCLKRWRFEVQPYGHARWSNGSWCIRAQCPTWKEPSFLQCQDLRCIMFWLLLFRGECMWAALGQHIHRKPGQQGLFDGGLWTCRWSVGTQQRYGGRRFSSCATKSTWWPSWLERWYETLWKKQPNWKHAMSWNVLQLWHVQATISMSILLTEVYFGPGDDIFRRGEVCKLGESLMPLSWGMHWMCNPGSMHVNPRGMNWISMI